ncbi:transposase [Paraburkholderia ribeironis]|uniref:transposase n=1 Tax=Paraburkholderia ribeironis TaxID=1247936 RepID=UPI000A5D65AF|nr:transposase [Paraburkholderia ribeironis]
MHFNELSDEEWLLIAPVLADAPAAQRRRGRPRALVRIVANAVLWVLTTGESWSMLPSRYPSAPTCRQRFETWRSSGALAEMYRILSSTGRKFRCGPQLLLGHRHVPAHTIARRTRYEELRKVLWKDQASWQNPHDAWQPSHTADTFRQVAPQRPDSAHAAPERVESRAPAPPHQIHRTILPWMGLPSKGQTGSDPRGYVIYFAADRLANGQFRGWAEIVRDERRVARSGLIGPSFEYCETAQQYALEWARRWIDKESSEWIDKESSEDSEDADEVASGVRQQKVRSG